MILAVNIDVNALLLLEVNSKTNPGYNYKPILLLATDCTWDNYVDFVKHGLCVFMMLDCPE